MPALPELNQTGRLRIQPVFARSEARVRARIFLCMLAYNAEWNMRNMRKRLTLILSDEDDPEAT